MNESDSGATRYLRKIGSIPLLTPEQEIALARKIKKGDAKAREHVQGHPFLAKPISISELVVGIEPSLPADAAFT